MDIRKLFNKNKKFEIISGGRDINSRMEIAFKLYKEIINLEDNTRYILVKNKNFIVINKEK